MVGEVVVEGYVLDFCDFFYVLFDVVEFVECCCVLVGYYVDMVCCC